MRTKIAFYCVLVLTMALLAGCAAGSKPIDKEQLCSIQPGKTTEADLVRMFGEPQSRTAGSDGTQYLTWTHMDMTGVALGGLGVPFMPPPSSQGLYVKLGPDGTVASYTTSDGNPTNTRLGP